MEKINFECSELKNSTIKIGKNKVEIKPIISIFDKMLISDICLKQFLEEDYTEKFKQLPMVKTIFDMLVLHTQTNMSIKGIVSEMKDGKNSIDVKIDESNIYDIEQYENSGILMTIKPFILNYEEVWKTIFDSISLANTYMAFDLIMQGLPSDDKIADTVEIITKFAEENKELVNQAVKTSLINDSLANAKNDLQKKTLIQKKLNLKNNKAE